MLGSLIGLMEEPAMQAKLAEKTFDLKPHQARLTAKFKFVTDLNSKQEVLRVDAKAKTAELKAALEDADTEASGVIDAICGILGKKSQQAKSLQKIRSRIRMPRAESETPPDAPKNAA